MRSFCVNSTITAIVGSCLLVACAGTPGAAPGAPKDDVASVSEGLHETACTTVAPDATQSGNRNFSVNTGATYGSTSCPQQFVAQLDNVASSTGPYYAWVKPTTAVTQALCPDTEASLDFYGSNDGVTWTRLNAASNSFYGVWVGAAGFMPAGCAWNSSNPGSLVATTGTYFKHYRVVGAILQHPANKSTAFDAPIPMTVAFEAVQIQ